MIGSWELGNKAKTLLVQVANVAKAAKKYYGFGRWFRGKENSQYIFHTENDICRCLF